MKKTTVFPSEDIESKAGIVLKKGVFVHSKYKGNKIHILYDVLGNFVEVIYPRRKDEFLPVESIECITTKEASTFLKKKDSRFVSRELNPQRPSRK